MNALNAIGPVFAQAMGGYSLLQMCVFVIVIAAAIAIVFIIMRQMGVAVPAFIVQIMWVLLAVFVGVFALYLLFSMVGRM